MEFADKFALWLLREDEQGVRDGLPDLVELSNGEYEVHNIGVNWPHHIFVNQNFKVVGAD